MGEGRVGVWVGGRWSRGTGEWVVVDQGGGVGVDWGRWVGGVGLQTRWVGRWVAGWVSSVGCWIWWVGVTGNGGWAADVCAREKKHTRPQTFPRAQRVIYRVELKCVCVCVRVCMCVCVLAEKEEALL